MAANTYTGGNLANVGFGDAYMHVDGADVGLIQGAFSKVLTINTKQAKFNNKPAAIANYVSEQIIEIDCTLVEVTDANFIKYLAGMMTQSGSKLQYGDKRGEKLTEYQVKIFPLHADGHPWSGRVFTFHICNIVPNGNLDIGNPDSDDFEGFPIKIMVLADDSQSTGEEFFTLDAVDSTAPTVSSTSPSDDATGVDETGDITVTFDKAMGEGTITSDNIVIMKSDFSADVTPSSLTLNSAKTTLTIALPMLDNSQEYVVILTTGIRSSDGVPLADAYEFDFTTQA